MNQWVLKHTFANRFRSTTLCCHHSFVARCNQNRPSTVVEPQATVLRLARLVFVPQAVQLVLALPVALLGSEQVELVRLERVEAVAIAEERTATCRLIVLLVVVRMRRLMQIQKSLLIHWR